jgi:HK97 family phage major capsid protein
MTVEEIEAEKKALADDYRALGKLLEDENRGSTPAEKARMKALDERSDQLDTILARDHGIGLVPGESLEPDILPPGGWSENRGEVFGSGAHEIRMLDRTQSIREAFGLERPNLCLGKICRGLALGRWDGAETEKRAVHQGDIDTTGGFTLPGSLAAAVIDKARAQTVCLRAGAQTATMSDSEQVVPRLSSDLTAYWVRENTTIPESNAEFERFLLTPKSLCVLGYCSIELLEDARNFMGVVENSLGKAIATKLDQAMLSGSGASGEPTGIQNSGCTATAIAGGLTLDNLNTAITTIRQLNHEPTSVIFNPRTRGAIEEIKDGSGVYTHGTRSYEDLEKFSTTQLAISGGNTTCVMGDFSQLVLVMRNELRIEAFRSGGSAHGRDAVAQRLVIIRGYLRADVLVQHELAFNNLTGISN